MKKEKPAKPTKPTPNPRKKKENENVELPAGTVHIEYVAVSLEWVAAV